MSEPFILLEQQCSYETLLDLVRRWNFSSFSSSSLSPSSSFSLQAPESSCLHLSSDLAHLCISFLTVEPVTHNQVTAVACSSTDGSHELQECLIDSETSWFMSALRTMPRGAGREWVEFRLGPLTRRLVAVCIKIPPLPAGPLSVRLFQLQVRPNEKLPTDSETSWITLPNIYQVASETGWQNFPLQEPVDALQVRILMLKNQLFQVIREISPSLASPYENVGFFAVRFE
jgi:hypothetical protein